jgi:transcriptional regulator with XRE-family HTH domain
MKKKYYSLVGGKIKALRESYNIELTEIADLIGIKHDEYGRYEAGHSIPRSVMEKLAEFYDVSISSFLPTIKECNMFWLFPNRSAVGLSGVHDGNKYYKRNGKISIVKRYEEEPKVYEIP